MPLEVSGMMFAGIAALAAGFVLVRGRFRGCTGVGRILVLGPVFEAAALAVFSAEHFTAARDLMPIVPRWLPYPLFWTYFVGLCLLAAAVSFVGWRHVPWSASLLALLFLIIVATIDLPNLPKASHNRFFWILTVRELSFAGGAMVLAGAVCREGARIGEALIAGGRLIVGAVMVFYGIEHFVYPAIRARGSAGKGGARMDACADADRVFCGNHSDAGRSLPADAPRGSDRSSRRGQRSFAADRIVLRFDSRGGFSSWRE